MRNMSFSMTTEQARSRQKTVTRRQAWWNLKPGTLIQQVEKGMGLKKGEKVKRIHVIRILHARPEPIQAITQDDVIKEGFPDWTPEQFIAFYCKHHGLKPEQYTNRIEFEYVMCDKCRKEPAETAITTWSNKEHSLCAKCAEFTCVDCKWLGKLPSTQWKCIKYNQTIMLNDACIDGEPVIKERTKETQCPKSR